jgi:hypothetical protein
VWLSALIYLTVAVTVLSGADYFFGVRRAPARHPGSLSGGRARHPAAGD